MATIYQIYRDGSLIGTIADGTNTFVDDDAPIGEHAYTVVAVIGGSTSIPSNEADVDVPTPDIPLSLGPSDPELDSILRPQLTYNGLTIGTTSLDANGVAWVYNDLPGWDFAPLRLTPTPRGQHHGVYAGPAFLSGREIIVMGHIASPDPVALLAAREQLHTAMATYTTPLPFIVAESPPKMCWVRANVGSKDRWLTGPIIEFEMHLLAADPLKYDPGVTVVTAAQPDQTAGTGLAWPMQFPLAWGDQFGAGIITAYNSGNTSTSATLTITGPCTNPTIENRTTHQILTLGITLLASDVLLIDLDSKAVTLNGNTARRGVITSSPTQWWSLTPGSNEIRFSTADGSNTGATCTIAYRSAWN